MMYALLVMVFKSLVAQVQREFDNAEARVYSIKWMPRFVTNTRGEGVGAGVVGTLIGIMVSLLIAIIIVQNLITSQTPDATWSTQANATWAALQANIWVALTLLVIVPIIVGAIIILSYVRRGM